VITTDYIDFSPLTADPTLAEGRQWFRSDFDAMYWSPDGSVIERIETYRPGVSGSLVGIKGFEYLVAGAATDSWEFTMNPSAGVWIKQYSTAASFNAQMVYHGAYQHWTGDNTFADVPNKAENVYGVGEEVTVHQIPDGTEISALSGLAIRPMGMCWDGQYLWTSAITVTTLYRYDTAGNQVSSFPSVDGTGTTWDGVYVWTGTKATNQIYQYTTDGTQISYFNHPPGVGSVCWDGKYLWATDTRTTYQIYRYTPDGIVNGTIPTPAHSGGDALTWDGQYLYWQDRPTDTVYQIKRDGTQVSKFSLPGPSVGLGWDGSYLWQASGGANTIYRIGSAGSFDLDYRIAPV